MLKFLATLARARIHIDARQLLIFLAIGVALPNSIPGLAAWHFGFYRAAINLDYLVPFLLLALPRQGFRAAGAVLLVLLSLVDCALILLEYFPTLNLGDILYLLGFIFSADNALITLFCGVVLYLAFSTFISLRYSGCLQTAVPGLAIFAALILQAIIHHAEPFSTSYIRNGLAESRLAFLIDNKDRSFFNILNADALHESPWESATQPWWATLQEGRPLNKKLLLIIAESWGQPNNKAIQEDVLHDLTAKNAHFDFFHQGSFPFLGLTVQGELRELCRLDTTMLDLREVKSGFHACLPNRLAKLGYKTYAMHNASDFMYGRDRWYKLAGFGQSWFKENLPPGEYCVPFDGVCDWDMLPLLKQGFAADEKTFLYWLTLTAHFYYAEKDIRVQRFQCDRHGLATGSDACQNLRHQAQFFDNLASMIGSPEMRGVEVIVVGDHVPPLFGAQDLIFKRENPTSRLADVPWVHFKLRD